MSNVIAFANAARDLMLDAITTAIGTSGVIDIYAGAKPSTPDTAIGAQVKLGRLTFSAAAAPAASGTGHVWTASAITQDSAADETGIAAWARVLKSDGTTKVFDCDVSVTGGVINLVTTSIVQGVPIQIASFTITLPGV